jgi:hypothetical protein
MQRALHYDGLLPAIMDEVRKVRMSPATPAEISTIKAFIDVNRSVNSPYDIVVEGETPGKTAAWLRNYQTLCRSGSNLVDRSHVDCG